MPALGDEAAQRLWEVASERGAALLSRHCLHILLWYWVGAKEEVGCFVKVLGMLLWEVTALWHAAFLGHLGLYILLRYRGSEGRTGVGFPNTARSYLEGRVAGAAVLMLSQIWQNGVPFLTSVAKSLAHQHVCCLHAHAYVCARPSQPVLGNTPPFTATIDCVALVCACLCACMHSLLRSSKYPDTQTTSIAWLLFVRLCACMHSLPCSSKYPDSLTHVNCMTLACTLVCMYA